MSYGLDAEVSEPEAAAMVQTASLELYPSVTETSRRAADRGLGLDRISSAARQAVTAWVMAVNGDDARLAASGEPHIVSFLLRDPWKRWHVVPGPRVTGIEIWRLEADREPPSLDLKFQFSGRRIFPDPSRALASELSEGETQFVGTLALALPEDADQRWRLTLGAVDTRRLPRLRVHQQARDAGGLPRPHRLGGRSGGRGGHSPIPHHGRFRR